MNNNIIDIYGLTPSQEGVYAQYFQNTKAKTYHLQNLCKINKDTDLDLIKKALEMLSLRHPILKTAFTVLKSTGAIKQVILENRKPKFTILEQDKPFSKNALDTIVDEQINKPLDLQRDSLFTITIIDFIDERFMLTYTHHIILDGWCFPILINDLQRYYEKLSNGISVDELSNEITKEVASQTSYAQYVNWIKNQNKNYIIEYWQSLLNDCTPSHIFNKEKKDNSKNEDIITVRTPLGDYLSQRIEQFAKTNKISPNTVFECAFSIALQKYSNSDDVVFDKIISGRSIPLKNIENTIGPFINTVPVRIKSDAASTFADLLKEIQDQTINANKNGILPLTEVYKACGIDSKSIDALFVFENYYTGDITDLGNGVLSPKLISFDEQTEFNLTVTIVKENNCYIVRTSYAKDIYTERDISSFIQGYLSILYSSLDNKTKHIKDITAIAQSEKSALNEFNNTEHTYDIPDNSTLYSLFESVSEANADKVCLKTDGKEITFGDFKRNVEVLDCRIREITENKKSIVALICERSFEMYSAIYGIIRGGNAYLPIDPDYPQDRIDYILENSDAALVVSQDKFTHLAGSVPCINMTNIVNNPTEVLDVPPCVASEDDTAYVIYTSGSTGNPKGAKVSHKSAVNRILWMHDKYPLLPDDVILQKTPYTFDVSVWEHFWWGIVGGCLAPSKPGEHFLPAKILEEVFNNKVTHLHFVPSVFELFLNYLESHKDECFKFNSAKYVFLSGEALSANLINRFYDLFDFHKVTLHNLYGPTECAVDVTYYDCSPDDTDPVPIGKPIYNTQMYVVDEYMNPLPIGVTGELCICGINVGQGYLNNPELTAQKFIDNPFGEGKLYKTGDLAYWQEDGNIGFVGRIDSQIKLNGQRIEIGEIESVINAIDFVETGAVIVKKVNGTDTLVAFYSGADNTENEIRDICSNKLPKYMVPSAIVHLDKLPLNQSGKLDRKALAQMQITVTDTNESDEPINETEKFICDAFEKVLGLNKAGRNTDFFDNGGTSLSMIAILSESGFEDISASEFMRNSTPAKLAQIIKDKKTDNFEYLEPLYLPDDAKKAIILLPFAGGGSEAFSNLVTSLKQKDNKTAIYFIRYLHSFEECEEASKEIAEQFGDNEISIYSHCVGSALAIQILKNLEKDGFGVKDYFAGASIPLAKPTEKNIWNIVPDRFLKYILTKAGAKLNTLSDEKVSELMKHFREDTDFANISYCHSGNKISVPLTLIISKDDIFTKNYKKAQQIWEKYFTCVKNIYFINSKNHYFQAQMPNEVAEIILSD